jgi:hypothetical protein
MIISTTHFRSRDSQTLSAGRGRRLSSTVVPGGKPKRNFRWNNRSSLDLSSRGTSAPCTCVHHLWQSRVASVLVTKSEGIRLELLGSQQPASPTHNHSPKVLLTASRVYIAGGPRCIVEGGSDGPGG